MAGRATLGSTRLQDTLAAVAAVSSDVSMEDLLERVVSVSARLVGARYGYLDVLDARTDRRLGRSARFGIDEAGLRASGPLPPGRQLLVDLITQGPRLARPDSAELSGFVCVPIESQGQPFGTLYLTDKVGGKGFTTEDDAAVLAVTAAAGVVIENVRLHERGERQRRWLAAAADITSTLRGPISRADMVQLVADRTREITSADFVALLVSAADGTFLVSGVSGSEPDGLVGQLIDSADSIADAPGCPDLGAVMVLPMRSDADTGALVVGWLNGHEADRWELDPVWPQRFADQAALVLQVARAREDLGRLAVFEDRDRIGRDLHDLVIQRLFAIGLRLDNTTKLVSSPEASERISSAIDEIDETIKDIRRTIFALNGAAESDDLRILLGDVIDKVTGPLGFRPELQLNGPIDSAVADTVREHLLAVLGEALSNVVRHAEASNVVVALDVGEQVELVVTDDGRGLSGKRSGSGLRNLRQRAKLLGGTCAVSTVADGGVELRWSVPR